MRRTMWTDLLRRQIHEQSEYVHTKDANPQVFDSSLSAYFNMKNMANLTDSPIKAQIEEDIRNFVFPEGYKGSSFA